MDKNFDKILLLLMSVSFIFLIATSTQNTADGKTNITENQYPGIMRFHVIANSNSDGDQALKLKVRDYVLEKLQNALSDEMLMAKETMGNEFSESKVTRKYIKNNLNTVKKWALEGLRLYNSNYNCQVSMGIRHIPAKYYDDIFFPEGNYEALTITIGEGKGENWWCVVFPPLCLVENDDSSYKSKLDMSESEKIKLKSKVIELMEDAKHSKVSVSTSSILKGIYIQMDIDAFFVKK